MILYLSVDTDMEDLEIDYMEVRLGTSEAVMIDWDESDIAREEDSFDVRCKGVYFNGEYANGKLSSLHGMQIESISLYTESESNSEIVLPYVISVEEG